MNGILRALVFLVSLGFAILPACAEGTSIRCQDLFSQVAGKVKALTLYQSDFGAGVFISKIGVSEFRVEPPLMVFHEARQAQKRVGELAEKNKDDRFTVLFQGFSEGEVIGFKTMLQRDAKLRDDENLSAILLSNEKSAASEFKKYEEIREAALHTRDQLLRRYAWDKAEVSVVAQAGDSPKEVYKLVLGEAEKPENFLLSLRLRGVKHIKNRVDKIRSLLASDLINNSTVEQMAHTIIADLKKSDPGITNGTLRVMAADFLIAQASKE